MLKLKYKVQFSIFFAIIIGLSFFYLNNSVQNLLLSQSTILSKLADIKLKVEQINHNILNSAYRLYDTYDEVNVQLNEIYTNLNTLYENPLLQAPSYQSFFNSLKEFENRLKKKEANIQRFITLNSIIKNSAIYIPTLSLRYVERQQSVDFNYLVELLNVSSTISLARNAMDADLLEDIKADIEKMSDKQFEDPSNIRFNQLFLSHAKVMDRYLKDFQSLFEQIVDNNSNDLIKKSEDIFILYSSNEARSLSTLNYFMMGIFLFSIIIIIYLLFNVEKSRKKQIQLHEQLKQRAMTDSLTELPNRFSFEQKEREINDKHITVLLINIDGFKLFNDFYGRKAGDHLLQFTADNINQYAIEHCLGEVFRVGADEFAVIIEQLSHELVRLIENIIIHLESKVFNYLDIFYQIHFSVGASNVSPYLETSDLALHQIKKSRKKYNIYKSELDIEAEVKHNLEMVQIIQYAINHNKIIPYFMPLLRNSDEKIVLYECLMRIKDAKGNIIFPDQFLPVAKKSRLYGKLTQIMFNQCYKYFADSQYNFSINLSINDIDDLTIRDFILDKLKYNPDIASRLTIELLESEQVVDYRQLNEFVDQIHAYGSKISIDDYGSGYSNLQHLLQLKIDNLKIDGSLIQPLSSSDDSLSAVHAIIEIAKSLNIATITAEYVSDEIIYNKIKSMGITYSQGFYIGKAAESPISIPSFKYP